MAKVTVALAVSLDGYVAGPNDGWRTPWAKAGRRCSSGVRLFDHIGGPVRLEKLSVVDAPEVTHLNYRVVKD